MPLANHFWPVRRQRHNFDSSCIQLFGGLCEFNAMAGPFRDHQVAVPEGKILGKGVVLEEIHKLDLKATCERGDQADAEFVEKMAGEPEIMVLCHLCNFDPFRHAAAPANIRL